MSAIRVPLDNCRHKQRVKRVPSFEIFANNMPVCLKWMSTCLVCFRDMCTYIMLRQLQRNEATECLQQAAVKCQLLPFPLCRFICLSIKDKLISLVAQAEVFRGTALASLLFSCPEWTPTTYQSSWFSMQIKLWFNFMLLWIPHNPGYFMLSFNSLAIYWNIIYSSIIHLSYADVCLRKNWFGELFSHFCDEYLWCSKEKE